MNLLGPLQILLMSTIVLIKAQHNIFCYYHMSKSDEFKINDIDPTLCSHLVYDDFKIDEMGNFKSDPISAGINGQDLLGKLLMLKLKYRDLKILAAVGKLNSYTTLSNMMSISTKRKKFIDTTVDFLKDHEFDGLDFGWMLGKNEKDKDNFVTLVKDLNDKLTKHRKILVLCVEPNSNYAKKLYNIPEIAKYANFIIMKTFELRRDANKVGFDAALYPNYNDNDETDIKSMVEFWLKQGVPSEKLIIYISTIGRKYYLDNTDSTYPGAATDISKKPESSVYYDEFCYDIKNNTKWIERWDNIQKVAYAYKSNIWINYDNIESVKLKTEFVVEEKLGGISFGPLQHDDYKGNCKNGKYPLLNTIYSNLKISLDEYKYIINVRVIKRHIRSGQTNITYNKEEEFGLQDELFSI